MKTFEDFEKMKSTPCSPFNSRYDYFISYLEDCYIAKLDGVQRIKQALAEWDIEVQEHIVGILIGIFQANNLQNFDALEFKKLVLS